MVDFEIKSKYNLKSNEFIELMQNKNYFSYAVKNNKRMNSIKLIDIKKNGNILNTIIEYNTNPDIPQIFLKLIGSNKTVIVREIINYDLDNFTVSIKVESKILDFFKSILSYSYKLYNIHSNQCLQISKFHIDSNFKGIKNLILKNMGKNIRKNNLITNNLVNNYINEIKNNI